MASKEPNNDFVDKSEKKTFDFGVDLNNFSFKKAIEKKNRMSSEERQHEAMRLIRCQIAPTDENKKGYYGEIFCVRNKLISVKKFVPFGVITHIPKILYDMLRKKETVRYIDRPNEKGMKIKVPQVVKAYSIEVLDPISIEEYNEIRARQLANAGLE